VHPSKACVPILVHSSGTIRDLREEQNRNASVLIEPTAFPNLTDDNEPHPEKHQGSISFIPSGIDMDVSPVQSSKARGPIRVTDGGSDMDFNMGQPIKELPSIEVIVLGIVTDSRQGQWLNALSIEVTVNFFPS
jgi:hypothetical protein